MLACVCFVCITDLASSTPRAEEGAEDDEEEGAENEEEEVIVCASSAGVGVGMGLKRKKKSGDKKKKKKKKKNEFSASDSSDADSDSDGQNSSHPPPDKKKCTPKTSTPQPPCSCPDCPFTGPGIPAHYRTHCQGCSLHKPTSRQSALLREFDHHMCALGGRMFSECADASFANKNSLIDLYKQRVATSKARQFDGTIPARYLSLFKKYIHLLWDLLYRSTAVQSSRPIPPPAHFAPWTCEAENGFSYYDWVSCDMWRKDGEYVKKQQKNLERFVEWVEGEVATALGVGKLESRGLEKCGVCLTVACAYCHDDPIINLRCPRGPDRPDE